MEWATFYWTGREADVPNGDQLTAEAVGGGGGGGGGAIREMQSNNMLNISYQLTVLAWLTRRAGNRLSLNRIVNDFAALNKSAQRFGQP